MSTPVYSLAFTFPGQGAQSVGMLDKLAAEHPSVKHTFQRAADALGKDLWRLASQGPEDELNLTQNTQPVMLAAGVAVWEVWLALGGKRPGWMAGHSLGEYTALVCAGALDFTDAIGLVSKRAELMQSAVPEGSGAMAAILGLTEPQVVALCAQAAGTEVVTAANFNAEGQVVIAGHAAAVGRAMAAAKALGAKRALPLPVSVPSHCPLMRPAAEAFAHHLAAVPIAAPDTTLIHNADVAPHHAPEVIRHALKEQLYKPVRWVETIKFMGEQGVAHFVECGPGKVLLGLNKRIVQANHHAIFDPESITHLLEQFA